MHREGIFEKHRQDLLGLVAVATGGAPVAQGWVGPVPQGYAWYIENASYRVAGNSHTAQFALVILPDDTNLPAVAAWDGAGLVAGDPAAAITRSYSPATAWYAGPGHYIHVYLFPGTLANGDTATATVQIAVHQLDPRLGVMTPEDLAQLRAAGAHLPDHASAVSEVATAGRRATDNPVPALPIVDHDGQATFDAGDLGEWGPQS